MMTIISDKHFNATRPFLSLKWKSFFALSLVLILVNASLAYLVFRKTDRQFDIEQNDKRLVQVRELTVVLSKGLESISTFSSFIPLLSVDRAVGETDKFADLISSVLSDHGLMLAVEWGVEGIHYFDGDQLNEPLASWPDGRLPPPITNSLKLVRDDEVPRGQLICDENCYQVVTLPLLQHGATSGYLIIERSIADSLHEFHLLSGADLALLAAPYKESDSEQRQLNLWTRSVPVVTQEKMVLPILQSLANQTGLSDVLSEAQRIEHASEWYEVFAMPPSSEHSDITVLVINKVTGQVISIRNATKESLILGLTGLVLSELILLLLMWGPMQRIQDVVYALPLLAEKSFVSLRAELPRLPADNRPRDEIDVMVNVIRDVSEQIESLDEARNGAENALRSSEQNLQLAQAMARVVSWVGYPLDGGFFLGQGADRIDNVLEGVETWTDFVALVHPDDQSRLKIAWRRGRAGRTMDIEFRLMIAGRCIDLHVMAEFSIIGSRRTLRAVGMMQDVTDMRAVQRALRSHRDRLEEEVNERTSELVEARNRAERLAKNKSDFLASMSHEIRTPLNAVLGLSQIGMRQSNHQNIAETFSQIFSAGEHLLNVVNNVLDLSKSEAGKLTIEATPFELRKIVMACIDMLKQRAQAKSLQMELRMDDDLPAWIVGDSFRLQQILINLLGNATKFTEHGSVVLHVYSESGVCVFAVKDTGIGMSSSQVGQLFKPFHQVGNSMTKSHEGTGLGLSISNTLAVLMGGSIHVRSMPNIGSEFILRLPLKVCLEAPESGHESAKSTLNKDLRLAGWRALVADDVSVNRTIVEALLEAEGAFVTVASDGVDAVGAVLRCGKEPFDVVLMDLEMPEMDGRQATRRIRASYPYLPIIGLTAHASDSEREKSFASGMNDQLVKPVMPEELVAAILRCKAVSLSTASAEK